MRLKMNANCLALLVATGLVASVSCSKVKSTANQQWKITVLSARIAVDRMRAFSSRSSTPFREERYKATIVEIKPEKLDVSAAEIDFFKTELITRHDLETFTPYTVATLTNNATGEKTYELYFQQTEVAFTLAFPDFPGIEIETEEVRKR